MEQQVPGIPVSGDEDESDGLPDACIYDENGEWAVLFEAKVQAKVNSRQLRRHPATASPRGYPDAQLVVLTVDQPRSTLPARVHAVQWRDIYAWFSTHGSKSGKTEWSALFTDYMQKFETKMVARDYAIRGTITMFDGLRFDRENPYTYQEAKRLLRLLGDELQKRKDLERQLGVDPDAERRQAITGQHAQMVWDYLPLKIARGEDFTKHPHLTIGIRHDRAEAATTIPNGIKGGLKTKLKDRGREGFRQLLEELESRLRHVVLRSEGATPWAYLIQRHFPSRSAPMKLDARIGFDLRTLTADGDVRYQPQWADAAFELLVNKRSNMQFGVMVQFPYKSKPVRSREVLDLFAETWIGMEPLLGFIHD